MGKVALRQSDHATRAEDTGTLKHNARIGELHINI